MPLLFLLLNIHLWNVVRVECEKKISDVNELLDFSSVCLGDFCLTVSWIKTGINHVSYGEFEIRFVKCSSSWMWKKNSDVNELLDFSSVCLDDFCLTVSWIETGINHVSYGDFEIRFVKNIKLEIFVLEELRFNSHQAVFINWFYVTTSYQEASVKCRMAAMNNSLISKFILETSTLFIR